MTSKHEDIEVSYSVSNDFFALWLDKNMHYTSASYLTWDETLEQADIIDAMVRYHTRDEAPVPPDVFVRQCDACLQHDTADRLRHVLQPSLVMCGRHDALTPPRFSRELADEMPHAELVTLHYGGHLVMVESAERFNRVVLQFLAEER